MEKYKFVGKFLVHPGRYYGKIRIITGGTDVGGVNMAINIQAKQNVSFLFSSLGSGAASVAGSSFLSDYMSIKNGSYAKLMKAYYGGNASDSVKSAVKSSSAVKAAQTSEEAKAYAKVQTTSDALKESADALLNKTLFGQKDIVTKDENGNETTVRGYDTDAIYKAVNTFVNDYNSVIKAVGSTDDDTVARRASYMTNQSVSSLKSLLAAGISMNEDGTLELNKESFMKTDMGKVKKLFNGNGSYGYQISAQASMINYAADHAANRGSSYTTTGSYTTNFSNGNLFNSYF